jgi:hypothetical protein
MISDFIESSKSILRLLRKARPMRARRAQVLAKAECYVFGNGPSLSQTLRDSFPALEKMDGYTVNHFVNLSEFSKLKPNNYVVSDPEMWIDDPNEKTLEEQESLFDKLTKNVDWSLKLFVPHQAEGTKFWKLVKKENSKLNLTFYNNVPFAGFKSLQNTIYRTGLGMPNAQNVLIAALFLAIQDGYKTIYLGGADHNFHLNISLDSKNRVMVRDDHFYEDDDKIRPLWVDSTQKRTVRMSELFSKISLAFSQYEVITDYAKSQGAEIINVGQASFIDAFKRGEVPNI